MSTQPCCKCNISTCKGGPPPLPKISNSKTVKFLEEFFTKHPHHPSKFCKEESDAIRADFKKGVNTMYPSPRLWEQMAMADYLHARWHGTPAADDFWHTGNVTEQTLCN